MVCRCAVCTARERWGSTILADRRNECPQGRVQVLDHGVELSRLGRRRLRGSESADEDVRIVRGRIDPAESRNRRMSFVRVSGRAVRCVGCVCPRLGGSRRATVGTVAKAASVVNEVVEGYGWRAVVRR